MGGGCQLQRDIKKKFNAETLHATSVRLGQVDFINCLPMNLPIELGEVKVNAQIINAVPSKLNEMILNSEIDIAPVSSYAYLQNKDKLMPVGDLCIASNGCADSVLLFSKCPIEELNDAKIGLSHASATSNMLLKVLLKEFYNLGNEFEVITSPSLILPPKARLALSGGNSQFSILNFQSCPAYLLIGDHALLEFSKSLENIFIYDLGTLWKKHTGLPMVFGMWVARKEVVEQYPDKIKIIVDQLNQSKGIGLTTLFNKVVKKAQEKVLITNDFYELYFKHLSYEFTDECKKGLSLFEEYCKKLSSVLSMV